MGRAVFDWVMIGLCVAIVVLSLTRPIDPTRRTLIIVASVYIGLRRGISLLNRTGSEGPEARRH